VVVNRPLDMQAADLIAANYFEVVAAPDFEEGVLEKLAARKNLRIFKLPALARLGELAGVPFLDVKSMTDGGIIPTLDGDFIRRYNAKDGYALAYAIKMGYKVCIITGGRGKTLENRLKMLGVTRAYIDCMDKISALHEYFAEEGIDPRNAIYMGDDIPDLECMREVGIPVCPADAAAEVIEASRYVSEFKGGEGAVRDIVEQVLRARGDWAKNSEGVTPSSLAASR